MDTLSVAVAREEAAIGRQAIVQGWVRTRRDSKGGFSFVELNDGSCLANIQVICDGDLPNYEAEIKKKLTFDFFELLFSECAAPSCRYKYYQNL